jgi:hypothetical protein
VPGTEIDGRDEERHHPAYLGVLDHIDQGKRDNVSRRRRKLTQQLRKGRSEAGKEDNSYKEDKKGTLENGTIPRSQ